MADVLPLFATPIHVFEPPPGDELPARITASVLAERASSPGIVRANAGGGWHSIPDLTLRPDAVYRTLLQRIVDRVGEVAREVAPGRPLPGWGVQAWSMVLPAGGWVVPHAHGEADWSVAWYADDGGAAPNDDAGRIAFLDPRPGMREWFPSTFAIRPQTGMLVVFPGFLTHFVHPWTGSRPRVTISANLQLSRR